MFHKYSLLLWVSILTMMSCTNDDGYIVAEENVLISPVVFNLDSVPYQNLSQYNFFEGEMSDLNPVYGVLPYDLNTPLFSDYAKKKRFIWMPSDLKANYVDDHDVLNFPVGTVLIKNFYYENVVPNNSKEVLETRLMIRKNEGWEFANYIWNEEQNEATFNLAGINKELEWIENGEQRSVNYRIPAGPECHTCHKTGEIPIPIGPKPRNLNKVYQYADGGMNQLNKLIEMGYLEDNLPSDIVSMPSWDDASATLDERVRSYLDVNCAHCHSEESHCAYRPIRFNYELTTDPVNLGVCVVPDTDLGQGHSHIVNPGNHPRSVLYYRINSTHEAVRMPLLGRTLIHDQGVQLVYDWIASLDSNCD